MAQVLQHINYLILFYIPNTYKFYYNFSLINNHYYPEQNRLSTINKNYNTTNRRQILVHASYNEDFYRKKIADRYHSVAAQIIYIYIFSFVR